MIRDGGGVGVVKVTGKPHPAGSPAWRAIMGGYVNRIGVGHDRSGQGFRWRVRCGLCMEPVGPVCHPTWREAMAAAVAHADRHRRVSAATEYGVLA